MSQRTFKLYTIYYLSRETYCWMAVFFLFFSKYLTIDQVLMLEAIYYASVVLTEVPSGYISDRWGRKPTLMISSVFFLLAYVLFFAIREFWAWSIAQVLLAVAISFSSGTDTSLLHDTMKALGREDEYGDREAILASRGAWMMGAGALLGGALMIIEPGLPYMASALSAVVMIGAVAKMKEPDTVHSQSTFRQQLRDCVSALSDKRLLFFAAFVSCAVIVNHIPYEFYQAYLELVFEEQQPGWGKWAPIAAGGHATLASLIAGGAAGWSMVLSRRVGAAPTLLVSFALQAGLVALMGIALHPLIAILLLGRGVFSAVQRAPARAEIVPRIGSTLSATFLSLQSLVGRLGYSLLLVALATFIPANGAARWPAFSAKSSVAAGVAALLGVLLVMLRLGTKKELGQASAPHQPSSGT